ncbi:MAG: hypothetical protein VYA17_08880 [Pseudomonadota bacterium]|nr:hypothetical protein [Pseudomonadota bacterium]
MGIGQEAEHGIYQAAGVRIKRASATAARIRAAIRALPNGKE